MILTKIRKKFRPSIVGSGEDEIAMRQYYQIILNKKAVGRDFVHHFETFSLSVYHQQGDISPYYCNKLGQCTFIFR